jgi:23S rRNA (uracil1939-C5)-methyltransferase
LSTHQGFWRFLVLRHSVDRDCWMVNIVTSEENPAQLRPLADLLIKAHPQVVSVVNNITASKAGVAVGEREIQLAGEAFITDRIGEFEFELSANSFFQTNTRGARRLYDTVKAFAGLTGSETVLDLYCGTGTIAIYLAPGAERVIGMELAPSAIADAQRNCRRNRIDNCRFVAGDIRRQLPQVDIRPDVMIIDPPRSGMHPDVVKQVLAMAPPKIVYVSCNPATMARDVVLMKDVYQVLEVQPVDMFPHTFHIESVARLVRK